jgi:dihydroorotate dehydrogenase
VFRLPNLIQALYKSALQPILFAVDAEVAHNWAVKRLKQLEHVPTALDLIEKTLVVNDPRLAIEHKTLSFANPVGLAAGFDKGAEMTPVLSKLGFGFLEIGTLTPLQQEGQKKPRLFRYKKEQALINRMGFNNPGVVIAMERLKEARSKAGARMKLPIGINIGKGRETPLDEAHDDYVTAFSHVFPQADYVVINVSSPNTPQLRDLQTARHLEGVLKAVQAKNLEMSEAVGQPPKTVFIKVSPDLHEETTEDIAQLALENNAGLIATNTTLDHSALKRGSKDQEGGLSGKPVRTKSNAVLKRLYQLTKGIVPIIGVGGIFTAHDAYEKIRLGASLVQVYTGWIYEGPTMVRDINKGLLKLMEKDGFKNIKEAVGTLS